MLELKRVSNNDIYELTKIKIRAFEKEFKKYGFTPEEMISTEWHKKMMVNSLYYKILKDNLIIGGVNIFKGYNGEYELCCIYIDSNYQNKGFGSQVIDLLEKNHMDGKKWVLETPSGSLQNHHFYEKQAYCFKKEIVPDGAPKGFSLKIYEKVISKG